MEEKNQDFENLGKIEEDKLSETEAKEADVKEESKKEGSKNKKSFSKPLVFSLAAVVVIAIALILLFIVFKHEHVFGEWQVTTAATCTKKGEETRSCECGELQSRGVPVIEHTYKDATCISAKTCSECGQTSGEPLGHDYNNATCTAPKTCNRCAETIGEALGHYFVDANCTTPKTCTVCSTTIGEALGHNFAAATCTTPKTCTLCEKTTGEALGHNYIEATCTEPKTCSDCGKKYGSAVGHSYLDATCTAPQTCSACGHTKGSPIAHNISSTTSYCTNCGKFGLNEVYATRMAVKSTIDWLNTKSLDGYEIYSIYYAYEDTCTCPNCLEDGGMGNPYINVIVFFEYTINGETDIWVNVVAVHDYYGIYYMLGGYRVGFAYYYKGKELTKIFSEDYSIYYEKEDLILVPAKNVL